MIIKKYNIYFKFFFTFVGQLKRIFNFKIIDNMRKFYASLLMLFVFGWASAQNNQLNTPGQVLDVSEDQAKELKSTIDALHSKQKGTDADWYSYAFTVDDLLGNPGDLALTYLFPDTQITAMFGATAGTPWVHGAATVMDPTSAWFDNVTNITIDDNDAYDLDSVAILCSYSRNTAASVVDTLIIEYIVGTETNMPTYYFSGMAANYGVDTVRFRAVTHTNGFADFATNTVKIPLTEAIANDTLSTGWNYIKAAPSAPIHMMPGEVVAMTFQFKPGYSYTQTDTLNNMNYFTMASYEEQGEDTYPTYSPGDFNSSQIMPPASKFEPGGSWDGFYIPEVAYVQAFSFENHLVDFKLSVNTGINEAQNTTISMSQNQPNPFDLTSTVEYKLQKSADVNFKVYNVAGSLVMEVNEGTKSAGQHNITINGSDLEAGVYYYTLTAGNEKLTKKMIVY